MRSQPELVLYHAPGTCSRVVMNALEEASLSYADEPVDIFKGQQRTPGFLAINPKGKVPVLLVGGSPMTEAPAILWRLANDWPEGGLLPRDACAENLAGLIDLSWCSNTLHLLARAIRMPMRLTSGDPVPVRESAMTQMTLAMSQVEARLHGSDWWYGDAWSILDVYISWVFGMAQDGGLPAHSLPSLVAHTERVRGRPSFQRALERERTAMNRAGIELPGGAKL